MYTVFVNATIISQHRLYNGGVAVDENGRIVDVWSGTRPTMASFKTIDAHGLYLSPGFIDIHTHGGGGYDFMDGSVEAVCGGCRKHLEHGTTSLLPSTVSSNDIELFESLECIVKASHMKENMPEILGIHLEGPYFSPEMNMAQDKKSIKNPDPIEYNALFERFPAIRIWSVAPELKGAIEMGRWMKANGIIASIGHSNATYCDVERAVDSGYTMLTHYFNGMSRLVRKKAKMYLGVAESGFLFNDLTAEIIADGCHLPIELLRLIYKIKGSDRICLVTDSMRAAGLDQSESILGSIKNGQRVVIEDGVAYMPDKSSFGGSIATADRLVRTMWLKAEVPLTEAVKMITLTPARLLGVDGMLGCISPGAQADILLFNDNVDIMLIMKKGKVLMQKL